MTVLQHTNCQAIKDFNINNCLDYARKGGLFVFGDVAMQGAYENDVPDEHRFVKI